MELTVFARFHAREGEAEALAVLMHWSGAHDRARKMSATWAAFARSGKPDNPSIPHWPSYTASDRATLILDRDCRIANDYGAEERNLWKEITRIAS
jgi:carboxylesterase type B